jgi:hypothetical protein
VAGAVLEASRPVLWRPSGDAHGPVIALEALGRWSHCSAQGRESKERIVLPLGPCPHWGPSGCLWAGTHTGVLWEGARTQPAACAARTYGYRKRLFRSPLD